MNSQDNRMKMTNYRWTICLMLFIATTINYMDRQVLSLTWKDFIAPEFNWTDANYGTIAGFFSILYSISMLFVGKFVDKIGTKKGYLWAIGIWSVGACLHTFCGIVTAGISTGTWAFTFEGAREAIEAAETAGTVIWSVSTVSIWLFLAARSILAVGESQCVQCRSTAWCLARTFHHSCHSTLYGLGNVIPYNRCFRFLLDGILGKNV